MHSAKNSIKYVVGPRRSICCDRLTKLVRASDAGLITALCEECLKPHTLSGDDFLHHEWRIPFSCAQCGGVLSKALDKRRYYFLNCQKCLKQYLLADFLPWAPKAVRAEGNLQYLNHVVITGILPSSVHYERRNKLVGHKANLLYEDKRKLASFPFGFRYAELRILTGPLEGLEVSIVSVRYDPVGQQSRTNLRLAS